MIGDLAPGLAPGECLLCGARDAATVQAYEAPDVYEAAVGVGAENYRRAWVRCEGCGFHYSRFSRDPAILDRIYDRDYRDSGRSFRTEEAEATFARIVALPLSQSESRQRVAAIKQSVARLQEQDLLAGWRRRPLRLLDVGGATGIFAFLFQDQDWRSEIVDPGVQGRFVEGHGVTYHARRFDGEFEAGPFDLVSMNYLLEHVADPRALLATAREQLAEDGLLYVEVPDELAFGRKPKEDDIFNACHLWMFGPGSLQRLLAEQGFEALWLNRGLSPRGHYALSLLAWRP